VIFILDYSKESATMFKTTINSITSSVATVIAISLISSSLFVNSLTIPENEGRALDSIGGGNILRGAHAGAAPRGSLDSIGGGNILRGSLDSIGGGNILRALDSIGGGNILRGRQVDSIGGGHILRDLDKNTFRVNNKRNFDELGSGSGWSRFVRKRNFDEIDGGRGFGSRFVKKAFDEIDGHGFGRFARNFDEIDHHGFGRFV